MMCKLLGLGENPFEKGLFPYNPFPKTFNANGDLVCKDTLFCTLTYGLLNRQVFS